MKTIASSYKVCTTISLMRETISETESLGKLYLSRCYAIRQAIRRQVLKFFIQVWWKKPQWKTFSDDQLGQTHQLCKPRTFRQVKLQDANLTLKKPSSERILTTALREVTLGNSSGTGSCVQIMCDTLQSLTRSDPADPGLLVYWGQRPSGHCLQLCLNEDAGLESFPGLWNGNGENTGEFEEGTKAGRILRDQRRLN